MIPTPLSLPVRRVMVVAPHPDDESLGCGGLLAHFARDGREVRVVFVTEGGASHSGSLLWPRERLGHQRRLEAEAALQILGVPACRAEFLGLRDADMPNPGDNGYDPALSTLVSLVSAFDPDLIVLPWRRDPHRDHRDAWALGMDALARTGLEAQILEYAVWLDELGAVEDFPGPGEMERVEFDIASVLDIKRAAVAAHLSQTTDLIADDPAAFRLSADTIDRLCGPTETYWRPCV